MSLLHPLIAPVWGGVLAHLLCHQRPPQFLHEFFLVLFGPPLALSYTLSTSFSISVFLRTLLLYLVSLGTSITIYRISPFHPLAKYPGPILAKVSRAWAMYHVRGGRQHLVSQELFARYGEVVRTGPDHLIMCNASAVPVVLGAKNQWPKSLKYVVSSPRNSIGSVLSTIDPIEHGKRRRVWDRAFVPQAIKSYEPLLHARVTQLNAALAVRVDQPIDLAEWFGFMALDFMGSFAYGGAFEQMAHGEDTSNFHDFILRSLASWETVGTMPWLRPIIGAAPKAVLKQFEQFSRNVIKKRIEKGSPYRDVFYYLLNEDGEGTHPPLNEDTLVSEAALAIVAGSDTTGTALSNAIVYLLAHPECFMRLRAELDAAAGEGAAYDVEIAPDHLVELEYLQAVISETLRLMPAVPNGVQRMPPPDGGPVAVAGHIVPVGTTVQIPTWSLQRDPRYFWPEPNGFWPKRWLPNEGPKIAEARSQDFKLDHGAYMPFNYGPGNCVGRSLALHEMRTVLSTFVRRFDVQFAPGFTAADWTAQLRDVSNLARGKLPVVLSKRK